MRLKEAFLFRDFSNEQIEKLKRITVPASYTSREIIIKYNDESNEFYILEEGKVQVEVPVEEGKNIISLLRPVAIFGEVGLLDEAHRSASVVATEPCKILVIKNSDFLALLEEDKDMGHKFYRSLCQILYKRMCKTTSQLTFFKIAYRLMND
ncbi:MAG: cyclic nucleotide-binding domain-containing protein [bacterium]